VFLEQEHAFVRGSPIRRGRRSFGGEQFVDGVFDGEEVGGFGDDDIDGRTVARGISSTHQNGRGGGAQFDDMRHFAAGHALHGVVGEDEVVQDGIEAFEGLACGICGIHLVPKVVEEHLGQETGVHVVVYQEHGS